MKLRLINYERARRLLFEILEFLDERELACKMDIAEGLERPSHTYLGGFISALEAVDILKGLTERRPIYYRLSEKGRQLLEELRKEIKQKAIKMGEIIRERNER